MTFNGNRSSCDYSNDFKNTVNKESAVSLSFGEQVSSRAISSASLSLRHNAGGSRDNVIRELTNEYHADDRIYQINYTLYNKKTDVTTYAAAIAIRSSTDGNGLYQYVVIHMTESDPTRPYTKSLCPIVTK